MRLVKSAVRTIEVLEYLAAQQVPTSIGQISEGLRYPQSSTTFLLHTLLELGYVDYNDKTRRFSASERVMLLGFGIFSELTGRRGVIPMMTQLAERSGLIALVGVRRGVDVQFLHIVQPRKFSLRYNSQLRRRHLTRSALGKILLSTMADREVGQIVRRINSEIEEPDERTPLAGIVKELREIRERGYSTNENVVHDYSTIAMQVVVPGHQRPIALGLSMPKKEWRKSEARYIRLLRNKVKEVSCV